MKVFLTTLLTMLLSTSAFAGVQVFNGTTSVGVFNQLQCSSTGGLSCTKAGSKMVMSLSTSPSTGVRTRYSSEWLPSAATNGTSATPAATSVYLTQISIGRAATLTGIAVLNAATVGTNKYIVALFNSSGTKLANSALAGVTTSGASAYQSIPFTSTYTVTTPGTYWIGLYVNGTTDRFYAIPAIGAAGGLAGSVGSQTFGTVANVTLPTTFTADLGPISFTY